MPWRGLGLRLLALGGDSCTGFRYRFGPAITLLQQLLGHASISTTARYLHVREKRLGQIRSPLGLRHWIFTLPAALRPLALQNQKAIYTLLFNAASETLLQFGEERFGSRLGVTSLLHTWGQNLMEHPHLLCLVTGGGLRWDEDGTPVWVGPKQTRYHYDPAPAGGCWMPIGPNHLRQLLNQHGPRTCNPLEMSAPRFPEVPFGRASDCPRDTKTRLEAQWNALRPSETPGNPSPPQQPAEWESLYWMVTSTFGPSGRGSFPIV